MAPLTRRRKKALAAAAPSIDPADRLSQLPDEVLAQILSFLPAREAVQTCILARTWRDVWKLTKRLLIAAPSIDPADRLSQLPDEVLAQILSFLPAREAVQTCILARTWRDVWKLTKRLLIAADGDDGEYVEDVRAFVDGLLRVRLDGLECAPLHSCEIMVDPFEDIHGQVVRFDDDDMDSVNTWIRLVLQCKVQTLRVNIRAHMDLAAYLELLDPPASRHLTRLVLIGVWFSECSDLDLSGCPALEYLKISESLLSGLQLFIR